MDIIIQNSSDKPIYQQIVDQVKDKVLTGVLQPGEALPSMRLLARELKISVITTKRAYEELEREGFLTTHPGRGRFVAEKNLEFAREERMRALEESLAKAVELARGCGVSERELVQLVTLLYSGE